MALAMACHGLGPAGAQEGVQTACCQVPQFERGLTLLLSEGLLDMAPRRAAVGVAQLVLDGLVGPALSSQLDAPVLPGLGQRPVAMPTTNGRQVKHNVSHGTSFYVLIAPGRRRSHKIERLDVC